MEHIESGSIRLQLVALINNRYPAKSSDLLHCPQLGVRQFYRWINVFSPAGKLVLLVIGSTEREREKGANWN